jgi:hypothetical protein
MSPRKLRSGCESDLPSQSGVERQKSDRADSGGQSIVPEEPHHIAARITQKLRDAGVACEVVNFVPTEAVVLRRDRIIISLALILLTVLAWSYLLWLSADMDMGGMGMTGFRMIPSGMALMVPLRRRGCR